VGFSALYLGDEAVSRTCPTSIYCQIEDENERRKRTNRVKLSDTLKRHEPKSRARIRRPQAGNGGKVPIKGMAE
jgi:hypothetical protein